MDIPAYQLGESSLQGVARVIQLASNECAAAPSQVAIAAYLAHAPLLRRYPEGGAASLRRALAGHHGLAPQNIVCGCGSEELIGLLARAYAGAGDEVIVTQYGYALFPLAARVAGAEVVMAPARGLAADVDALLGAVSPRTRLLFLANPNNPTGSHLPAAEIARLHRGLPGRVLLVLDAAYAEYAAADDYDSGLSLAASAGNVVVLRTFSKVYGLASLRVGWLYGPAEIVSVLDRVRAPSNLSGAAQAAAMAALEDQAHVAKVVEENAANRAAFIKGVRQLGLEPSPSAGNFVLVRFPPAPGAAGAYVFLRRRGILGRPMKPYALHDRIRFTMGTADDMTTVIGVLAELKNIERHSGTVGNLDG